MHKFRVTITQEVELSLHDDVIAAVTDEWRKQFYPLHTPDEIAQHVAFNLVVNRARLSTLDGWADQPDTHATFERVGVEIDAEVVEPVGGQS